ncbi:MAG TPA: GSU2403 family nucleotidyltransferase fold protein [Stellaceae bacterium]|nr:GSU2403 family nucleotidyltransferase fold protein [Stellaceae bacterium]
MADSVSLMTQTAYAELVDRCAAAVFQTEFPPSGSFVRVAVKERDYWYFQQGARDASGSQPRKYVGPDTPEIRKRIEEHKQAKNDYRERRHLVAILRRAGFQSSPDQVGSILAALAAAGVFRLRACLVGIIAYQVYGPMLGIRLPHAILQTGDIDIAQFTTVSIAIGKDEHMPSLLEVLQQAEPSFRAVPHLKAGATASYVNAGGFRVDVLTENRGPDRDAPIRLPALGTHALPLRFLDFLIYEEIPAVVLHDAGILVNVPSPARFAVHKLIVAQRRKEGAAKVDKDLKQAEALIDALVARRPHDLKDAWNEAAGRGAKWRELMTKGLSMIAPAVRDRALHVFGAARSILPGSDLRFTDAPPRYNLSDETVRFEAQAGRERILCAISREALGDHFGADDPTKEGRLDVFRKHRKEIQEMARLVYLDRPVPADGAVLITTSDVAGLREQLKPRRVRPT